MRSGKSVPFRVFESFFFLFRKAEEHLVSPIKDFDLG